MKPNKVKTSRPVISDDDAADDLEISRLQRLLGKKTGGKGDEAGLSAELKGDNMFELFTCVDHLFGVKKAAKDGEKSRADILAGKFGIEANDDDDDDDDGEMEEDD